MNSPLVPPISLPARSRRVLLAQRPIGVPQPTDFEFDEMDVPSPGPDEALVRTVFLSVDPAQRGWAADVANYSPPVPLGAPMRSLGVGYVAASNRAGLAVGDYVYGWLGWQDYAVVGGAEVLSRIASPAMSLSAYAGVLGINGLTAWLALDQIGRPRPGQTILVSTAAGAVGSIVGQLARAAGCRTVGLTSDAAKIERCSGEFGYDVALNYKDADLAVQLDAAAPDGFDIYFDNVGGPILDLALRRMRVGGRVVQCGTASIADWSGTPQGPRNEREVLTRRLIWGGFVIFDHLSAFPAVQQKLLSLISTGKLVHREEILHGLEAAPASLRKLYAGENTGKLLIQLS